MTVPGPAVKIGLEIHGYLDVPSRVKLFCSCSLEPAGANEHICPVCTGQPGAKPMLPNKEAVDAILRIALFLECEINPELLFQRKHYSWPDLPNGYQKTMSGAYSQPVGLNGTFLGVGIEEIHLEEDPARWDPVSGGVDYNRSGFPLVEIVTKPEFTSAEHARIWIENLMAELSRIKAVRKDLGVKCDVNVSIAPAYVRTEVKNVNSFSAIEAAIRHEIEEQTANQQRTRIDFTRIDVRSNSINYEFVKDVTGEAGPVLAALTQQTRAWDEASGTTKFMRSKETALDYMFIPDPDLPVIEVSEEWKENLRKTLPKSRESVKQNMVSLGVSEDVAEKLLFKPTLLKFAEQQAKTDPENAAGYYNFYANTAGSAINVVSLDDNYFSKMIGSRFDEPTVSIDLYGDIPTTGAPLTGFEKNRREEIAERFIEFRADLLAQTATSSVNRILTGQESRELALKTLIKPNEVIELLNSKKSLEKENYLDPLVADAIAANPVAVADVKKGNDKAINAIVGHVIKALKANGKSADPAVIQKLVRESL